MAGVSESGGGGVRAAGGVIPMRVHLAHGGSSPRRCRDRMMQGDGEHEGQICASYSGGGATTPWM